LKNIVIHHILLFPNGAAHKETNGMGLTRMWTPSKNRIIICFINKNKTCFYIYIMVAVNAWLWPWPDAPTPAFYPDKSRYPTFLVIFPPQTHHSRRQEPRIKTEMTIYPFRLNRLAFL